MEKMSQNLVSIVIPVYNGSDYLRKAIESALSQTYKEIEVIVVNDGSSDDGATEEVALSFSDDIRYFSKKNGGVASALNFAISKMNGKFMSWLSHDDLYLPEKIETQLNIFLSQDNPRAMIWSDYYFIDENDRIIDSFALFDVNKKSDAFSILSTFVNGCTILMPTILFKEVGLFNENLRTTQDNEMWTRAIRHGYSLLHVQEKLIYSRKHDKQGQVVMASKNREETVAFYKWAIDYLDGSFISYDDIMSIISKKGINIGL